MSFLDYVNAALDLAKKAQSVELERQILAMQSEMNEMQRKNLELTSRVAELEKQRDLLDRRTYREPSYYVVADDRKEDGPFCQPCWDSTGKVVRTHDFTDSNGTTRRLCYKADIRLARGEPPDPYSGFRRR